MMLSRGEKDEGKVIKGHLMTLYTRTNKEPTTEQVMLYTKGQTQMKFRTRC